MGNAEPKYEEHFTVFIDFLGFSEASTEIDDTARQKVLDLLLSLTLLRGEFDIQSIAQETSTTHFIKPAISTFSDHIVISYPLAQIQANAGFDEHALSFFVTHQFQRLLTSIAANALRIGFLVRGGATVGKMYHARGVVFGEAMIEAYQIESRISVYPRVVLSPKITDRWTWIDKQLGIIRDNDGLLHFDYFMMLFFMSAPPGTEHSTQTKAWLTDVIKVLSRNLTGLKAAGKLNEFAKWVWFARQFRAGIERIQNPELLKISGLSPEMIPLPE